jgi:hypothetical protein
VRLEVGNNLRVCSVARVAEEDEMLRVSFSSMTAARAAVNALEAYGYSARQLGRAVVTDCPTLLAIPAIQKRVGLAEIERLELDGGRRSSPESDEFPDAPNTGGAMPASELTA